MCYSTAYTCVAVSDPLLTVQNYSMWMFSNICSLISRENDENCVVDNMSTVFWFNKQNEFETIWWWLWWKISNISRGNTNYVDFYHFAEAQCHSFRGPAGLFVTAASARSRQVFLWDWDCDADGVTVGVVVSVARFWQAFTATFAENHGHFRIFHAQLSKNLPLHDISKHNHNKKTKNTVFGEGFCHFFKFLLYIFGLHKFSKLNYLTVTHGHFHRINFSLQVIIIYSRFWVI